MSLLIGIDWGSSNVRSFLIDTDGSILQSRCSSNGIISLQQVDFLPNLKQLVEGWPSQLPILLCGMIGSAHGWQETHYVTCPTTAPELATELVDISQKTSRHSWIVPGLRVRNKAGFMDLMRGEECQLFGASQSGSVCLPGTHSKWANLVDGTIQQFSTHMTGEVFAHLSTHGLIAKTINGTAFSEESFVAGVQQSTQPGGLLHHLFSARARVLQGDISATACHAYLSGLLIGTEIQHVELSSSISLIGNQTLLQRYQLALSILSPAVVTTTISGQQACAKGLLRIWKAYHG